MRHEPDWTEYALCTAAALRLGPDAADLSLWHVIDARLTACRAAEGAPRHSPLRIHAARLARLERRTERTLGYRWTGKHAGMVNPKLR